jgi:hypothetical protein
MSDFDPHPPDGTAGTARDVDPERTRLTGVAGGMTSDAEHRGHGREPAAPSRYEVWRDVPSADGRDAWRGDVTYFDRPVLKEHVWIWSVPAYFHVGGVAGAAALLGAIAQTDDELRGMVDRCRWMAAIGTTVGTGLLIEDLGRPERFLNMLRVFRPTSPMSVGSWVLAATASLGSAGLVATLLRDRVEGQSYRRLLEIGGDATFYAAGALGMPLAGYTAVLVTNTAVPVWQAARRTLPPMFMASAVAGAASALEVGRLSAREARVVRVFGILGAVADLALGTAVEREAGRLERVGRPYHEGISGDLWKLSKLATALGLLLRLIPGGGRWRRLLSGSLGTIGSASLRFAVFHAGTASARDPRAAFQNQRAGHGGREATGAAAVVGAGGRRAV